MQDLSDQAQALTVLVIGPSSTLVGGIASVVGQTLGLDYDGRYRLEHFPITVSPDQDERLTRRIARHIRQMGLLRATIRRTGARIVHIHTCSRFSFYRSVLDMVVAQGSGCRVILHIHGAAFDGFHAAASPLQRWIIRWSLTRADRVVALSEGWRKKLRQMARRARITAIENAVEEFSIRRARRHNRLLRFLLLARMDEWKGIEDLLDACVMLHAGGTAFRLVLAGPSGTAGDETALGQKIRSRDLKGTVCYVGPVRGKKKLNLLKWADVYVQPSHHEGMPISLLEALACGLPIVATDVGAVPEVIEDRRQGLLVPPRQPAQLARAMHTLASDRRLLETLSREAQSLASRRFSLRRFRNDLLSLYGAVLSGDAAASTEASPGVRTDQAVGALL